MKPEVSESGFLHESLRFVPLLGLWIWPSYSQGRAARRCSAACKPAIEARKVETSIEARWVWVERFFDWF